MVQLKREKETINYSYGHFNVIKCMQTFTYAYQKRWPHKLITASLEVSKQMLHSNVLSWLPVSPCVWVLEPVPGLSVAEELDD